MNIEPKKLDMSIPPSALYCPVCNTKAIQASHYIDEIKNRLTICKCCENCNAEWDVEYNIIPIKITNLQVMSKYKEIPLN